MNLCFGEGGAIACDKKYHPQGVELIKAFLNGTFFAGKLNIKVQQKELPMQVSSLLNAPNNIALSKEDKSVESEYLKVMNRLFPSVTHQTRDEINTGDAELAQFRKDLTTKGAATFLKELNEEKIEALVEAYRQKLLKEQEANPNKPMDIAKMVSDFKKKLMEELMEIQKAEKKLKDNTTNLLSTSDILSTVKQTKETKNTSKNAPNFLEQILSTPNTKTDKEEIF